MVKQAIIEVETDEEASQLTAALEDAAMRAFVRVTAILEALPDDAARERVLRATCIIFGLEHLAPRRVR